MPEDLTWKHHTLYVEDMFSGTDIVLNVRSWTTIRQVKRMISGKTGIVPSGQRLCWQGRELKAGQTMMSWINNDMSIKLQLFVPSETPHTSFTIEAADDAGKSSATAALIASVKCGLQDRCMPIKTDEFEGSGGVYFLTSSGGQRLAVFKPQDEEQGMPQNPKYYRGDGVTSFKEHFKAGDNCIREVAAYMLDIGGFTAVPTTTLVHCEHEVFSYPNNPYPQYYPKFGSLQQYVVADDVFENLGPRLFTTLSIQKIALFDLRILNCDRNSSNILVEREISSEGPQYNLIPIDHGFSLPTWPYVCAFDWCWYDLPQVREPVCPEIVEYMRNLNIDEVTEAISSRLSLPVESIFLLRTMHQLILASIDAGLTLKDIADLVAREDDDAPASKLEVALTDAVDNTYRFFEMTQEGTSAHGVKGLSDLRLFNTTFKAPPAVFRSHDSSATPITLPNKQTNADADGAYTEEKQSPVCLTSTTGINGAQGASVTAEHIQSNLTRLNAVTQDTKYVSPKYLAGAPIRKLSTLDTSKPVNKSAGMFRPSMSSPMKPPRFSLNHHPQKQSALQIRQKWEGEDGREEKQDSNISDDLAGSPPGFWKDSYLEMHAIVEKRASQHNPKQNDDDTNNAAGRYAQNDGVESACDEYGYFDDLEDMQPETARVNRPSLTRYQFDSGESGESEVSGNSDATIATDLPRNLPTRLPLTRVLTFSAFDSPIEYDTQHSQRFNTAKQERRQALAETQEFSDCRWQLLMNDISTLVGRTARLKRQML